MTYSQSLWTPDQAHEMVMDWLSSVGFKDQCSLVIENAARDNAKILGWADLKGDPWTKVGHRITISLPVIAKISAARGLDPLDQFRETVLHEYAHVLHNHDVQEQVEIRLAEKNLGRAWYWSEWMAVKKQRGWSGHGTRWRAYARSVGAVDRATVRTQVNAATRKTQAASAVATTAVITAVKPARRIKQRETPIGKLCLSCFTHHAPGQLSCEY